MEEEPEPHYFDTQQIPLEEENPKDQTFEEAGEVPFCDLEDDNYTGKSLLKYSNTPVKGDPNIAIFPRSKKLPYNKVKNMLPVTEDMDQNDILEVLPRKSKRMKEKLDRLTYAMS